MDFAVTLHLRNQIRNFQQQRNWNSCVRSSDNPLIFKRIAFNSAFERNARKNIFINSLAVQMIEYISTQIIRCMFRARTQNRMWNCILCPLYRPGNITTVTVFKTNHFILRRRAKRQSQIRILPVTQKYTLSILMGFKRIIDFLPFTVSILRVDGFGVNNSLIQTTTQIKDFTGTCAACLFFMPGHLIHFLGRNHAIKRQRVRTHGAMGIFHFSFPFSKV